MRIMVEDLRSNCSLFSTNLGALACVSIVDYASTIKVIEKMLTKKKRVTIKVRGYNYTKSYDSVYECVKYKDQQTDIAHAFFYLKDTNINNRINSYIFFNYNETKEYNNSSNALKIMFNDSKIFHDNLCKTLHAKLTKYSPIAIQKDWIDEIVTYLIDNNNLRMLRIFNKYSTDLIVLNLNFDINNFVDQIQNMLKNKIISVNNTHKISPTASDIQYLDNYLDNYSELLANKIKTGFKPKFDPKKDKYNFNLYYFDNYCRTKRFFMYDAQKAVAQAMSNHLDKNNVGFIIGEMGCGKTILSLSSVYTNLKKSYSTNIVLCPPHLVEKWQDEIEAYFPNSEAIIIDNFDHFMNIKNRIEQTEKHLFLILSNTTAKMEYYKRPAVVWKESKKAFCCPTCGQPLFTYEKDRITKQKVLRFYDDTDFLRELQSNAKCMNKIKKFNTETGKWEEMLCNESLWTPVTKDNDSEWIKLGKHGWVMKDRIDLLIEEYSNKEHLLVKESNFLIALTKAKKDLAKNAVRIIAPQKYQISRYIREYYKGRIDYLIADEIQDYKGSSSKQGEAFGDLIKASKKTIGLTGTLLNGYASSLFYLLFRAFPNQLIKEGFEYNSVNDFVKQYGVYKTTEKFQLGKDNKAGKKIGGQSVKEMPGVSPLVFTNFLLENAVFIGLDDIAEGLPPYSEIPIGIDMNSELGEQYKKLEHDLRGLLGFNTKSGFRTAGAMLQLLSVYPDTPYNQPPIIDPQSGDMLLTVPSMIKQNRDKEQKLLEIVQEKISNDEKVLIYYQWPNRSDVGERLTEFLNSNNIKTAHMTSSVSAKKRASWIRKKIDKEDVKVVICTSSLVETGLDLLDFTTIIFYQVGYSLFTLRQASRRSWRLSQPNPVEVYFLYYKDTIQEKALSLMANKLKAAMVIEGKFNEEGLHALSNEDDLLTQIASSIVKEIEHKVDEDTFEKTSFKTKKIKNGNKIVYKKIQENPNISNFSYFLPNPESNQKKSNVEKYLSRVFNKKEDMLNVLKG